MAVRDEIIAFCNELLDADGFADYVPNGLQVPGRHEVARLATGVTANRRFLDLAVEAGADLALVHHGLFFGDGPSGLSEQLANRLRVVLGADMSLAAYHLPLDAHPEIGNNVLLAKELGVEVERRFGKIGFGGSLADPTSVGAFVELVRERLGSDPLVFDEGPPEVLRVAISSGRAGYDLELAATEGYELFITGEPEEGSLHIARELKINFVAAGHYATERLGVQALAARLAERFGLEWEFLELPNPV